MAESEPLRKINLLELESHNTEDSLWVVINGKVYDMTEFYRTHPGGPDVILEYAGKDGTERFE